MRWHSSCTRRGGRTVSSEASRRRAPNCPELRALARRTSPDRRPRSLLAIERAAHPAGTLRHDVCVDHRRVEVGVSEQLLHGANVVTVFQQVRRKAMPQRVTARRLGELRRVYRSLYGTLNDLLVQMVAHGKAGVRIAAETRGRKEVLPSPARARLGILAGE